MPSSLSIGARATGLPACIGPNLFVPPSTLSSSSGFSSFSSISVSPFVLRIRRLLFRSGVIGRIRGRLSLLLLNGISRPGRTAFRQYRPKAGRLPGRPIAGTAVRSCSSADLIRLFGSQFLFLWRLPRSVSIPCAKIQRSRPFSSRKMMNDKSISKMSRRNCRTYIQLHQKNSFHLCNSQSLYTRKKYRREGMSF